MKGKPKEITTMQEVLNKERKFINKYLCSTPLRIEWNFLEKDKVILKVKCHDFNFELVTKANEIEGE
jgi:hypothetical protein